MIDLDQELDYMKEVCGHYYKSGFIDGMDTLMRLRDEEIIKKGRCDIKELLQRIKKEIGE